MTPLDIAEMVADWSAMAEELGQGSARSWADKTVGSKWNFDASHKDLIYRFISKLEDGSTSRKAFIKYRGAVYRVAYLFSDEATSYLYHVTTYSNLKSISQHGLKLTSRLEGESAALFLTEPGGLVQWASYVKTEAPYRLLNRSEDSEPDYNDPALQPVVLRTPILSQKELDQCGTNDAQMCLLQRLRRYLPEHRLPPHEPSFKVFKENRDVLWKQEHAKLLKDLNDSAKAYKTSHSVPAAELEVWTGTTWVPLAQWSEVRVPYNFRTLLGSLTRPVRVDPSTLQRSYAVQMETSMTKIIKYRGQFYRKAEQLMPPKNIIWGPEEWPSDEYLATLSEQPPLTKDEYLFLQQEKVELERKLEQASTPEERRVLSSALRSVFSKITETKAWLHDKRPKSSYRLKYWAESR